MSEVIEVKESNFQREVLDSTVPVLVDAFGRDCRPCRQMASVVRELAGEVAGRAKVVTLDVEDHLYLAVALQIKAVPTFVVFRHGQEVGRLRGIQPKVALIEALGGVTCEHHGQLFVASSERRCVLEPVGPFVVLAGDDVAGGGTRSC